jgi:hypothetical protein
MALPLSNEPFKGGREALPVSAELSEEGGPFSLFQTRRREEGGRRSLPAGSRRKNRRLCGRLAGGWGPFDLRCGLYVLAPCPCAPRLDAELDQLLVAVADVGEGLVRPPRRSGRPEEALLRPVYPSGGHTFSAAHLDSRHKAVNTATVKTTFDLPNALIRKAKALAAQQGRPLLDLVAEAIHEKLEAAAPGETDATSARGVRREAWERWKSRLEQHPDGTWFNPEGIDDEIFFQSLEGSRREP